MHKTLCVFMRKVLLQEKDNSLYAQWTPTFSSYRNNMPRDQSRSKYIRIFANNFTLIYSKISQNLTFYSNLSLRIISRLFCTKISQNLTFSDVFRGNIEELIHLNMVRF